MLENIMQYIIHVFDILEWAEWKKGEEKTIWRNNVCKISESYEKLKPQKQDVQWTPSRCSINPKQIKTKEKNVKLHHNHVVEKERLREIFKRKQREKKRSVCYTYQENIINIMFLPIWTKLWQALLYITFVHFHFIP